MEKEISALLIRFTPERFVVLCRCVKDDFEAWAQSCEDDPYEDHSEALDRMEEDIDLLASLLPHIRSRETEEAIEVTLAGFRRKLEECSLL